MNKNGHISKNSSYLEYYSKKIMPVFKELDIAIKSGRRLKNQEIGKILGLCEKEVEQIRRDNNIKNINRQAIIKIMESGTSEICGLFQREMTEGSPFTYTKEQIAFIYGLPLSSVNEACNELCISEITWQNMPMVFGEIPYPVSS